jgi:hypothetical protein
VTFHVWIQLLEQIARNLCPVSTKVFLFQEEVDAKVRFTDNGRVLNREIANAR